MHPPANRFTIHLVRSFVAVSLLGSTVALAQSHPAWWTYASPEATALVGMRWNNLRSSPFARAVSSELRPGGSLKFPNVPMLGAADQILISSPEMLAMEYGVFPPNTLAQQAGAARMGRRSYRDVDLWVSAEPGILSIARINNNLLLIGSVPALQDAIERGQYRAAVREAEPGSELDPEETPTSAQRAYTPLLAKAAKYSEEDLWAVSTELPDPLASLFVPLGVQADEFEGSVSFWQGMHLVAGITADTIAGAVDVVDYLRGAVSGNRPMASALDLNIDRRTVLVRMDLNDAQFAESLRSEAAQAEAAPATTAQPQPAAPVTQTPARAANGITPAPASSPAVVAPARPAPEDTPAAKSGPRVVRIVGLEEKTREIEMPKNQGQR